MIFSSITFLYFFLPAVLVLYFLVPAKARNSILFLSSLIFYGWGEKLLVFLFAFSILITWIFGLLIEKRKNTVSAKILLIISIIFDLSLLVYFKYTDFFISSFNSLFSTSIPLLKIALPIGISFYTFQLISYKVDVYWGTVNAQKNLIDFGAYVAMFPQLIAGPIVRYADIEGQLKKRTYYAEKIGEGINRFVIGFAKKILIANSLGELIIVFKNTSQPSVLFYWLYALAFMLQIYFDFSGYSDMAIGLGKIFGFTFNENFNYPYISKSITEFWRRWHISLGSWFRDYVYIPLGGNKKGLPRQLFNIFVVWMLTGFWHGAAWNFIFWGIFYSILLMLEKAFLKKYLDKHSVVSHLYTLFFVMLGFVLFNADSLQASLSDIAGLFAFGKLPFATAESLYYCKSYSVTLILGIIGSTPVVKILCEKIQKSRFSQIHEYVQPVILVLLLVLCTAYLVDGSFNPFLYFRF